MDISPEQMYQIEENGHQLGFPRQFMMENAGAAAVRKLIENVPDIETKKILVFAGHGNNGGDALVMSRHLAGYGSKVKVVLLSDEHEIKTSECKWNWELLKKMPSVQLLVKPDLKNIDSEYDIVVDGIFGTGISGNIREPHSSAIDFINSLTAFKFAVDVPSGLDPGSGMIANKVVQADLTVTFHKMKSGIPKRIDLCGNLFAEKIGIPPEAEDGVL